MENQRAGRPAVAAPPDSVSQTASVSTRVLQRSTTGQTSYPTTYRDLPAEILQEVAGHLPFDEAGNLSTVSRRSYYALQERRLSWLCYQRAKHAKALDLVSV
ncbi:F-box protein [Burkholderia sp. b13]|uniref:F-box protein n=1 Tax=Burkholderiaceae TaxID=119060 RepID=UPI0009F8CA28|nr:F-box protein [Mycetohabitans sp. B4]